MMTYYATAIETPFSHRHICWFCGEPSSSHFTFPPVATHTHIVLNCIHPQLSVPCCPECSLFAHKAEVDSIWAAKEHVKCALIKRYKKDLAIGILWTPETLARSEFEGGNFAGFQKSAWFMYEVAKGRVNHKSCELILNGVNIENEEQSTPFLFDGVVYPDIDNAVDHYAQTFGLQSDYFKKVLAHLLQENDHNAFSKAVRFCRIQVGSTPIEREKEFLVFKMTNKT